MSTVAKRVEEIVTGSLGVTPGSLTPGSKFREDLGADSLDLVEITMAFEAEFEIEISDEDARTIETIGEVVAYIERKIGNRDQ